MHIEISITKQLLTLHSEQLYAYPISSAANGIGFEEGSYKTPTGNFKISQKIGAHQPLYTIFKGRTPQGIWDPSQTSDADLITTRILWLDGLDPENQNTKDRYIYIHGTNHESQIGSPTSSGCIRMRNQDIIDLYEKVTQGTKVTISI